MNNNGLKMYEAFSDIDEKYIEEAENYRTSTKKMTNVKGVVVALGVAAVAAIIGIIGFNINGGRNIKEGINENVNGAINSEDSQLANTQIKKSQAINIYAAGLESETQCLVMNGEKNLGVDGVSVGLSRMETEELIHGTLSFRMNVTGDNIVDVKYALKGDDTQYDYSLGGYEKVEKDSLEYLSSSSGRYKKSTESGEEYYIIKDLGKSYEEKNASDSESAINVITFSKKKSYDDSASAINYSSENSVKSYKAICDELVLEVTAVFEDGSSRVVELGFTYPANVNQENFYKEIKIAVK